MSNLCIWLILHTDSAQEDIEYHAEKQDLLVYCHAKKHLIKLYLALKDIQEQGNQHQEINDHPTETNKDSKELQQSIAELLHVTATEAQQFLAMIDRYQTICLDFAPDTSHQHLNSSKKRRTAKTETVKKSSKSVTGKSLKEESNGVDINSFLSCFIVRNNNNQHHINQHQQQQQQKSSASSSATPSNNFKISLNEKLTSELRLCLGMYCYPVITFYVVFCVIFFYM